MIIESEEFASREKAEAFRKSALEEYPASLYGTRTIIRLQRGGFWQCVYTRFR